MIDGDWLPREVEGDAAPAFVKFGTYLPHPMRLCLNGHEWAKQQRGAQGDGV